MSQYTENDLKKKLTEKLGCSHVVSPKILCEHVFLK